MLTNKPSKTRLDKLLSVSFIVGVAFYKIFTDIDYDEICFFGHIGQELSMIGACPQDEISSLTRTFHDFAAALQRPQFSIFAVVKIKKALFLVD